MYTLYYMPGSCSMAVHVLLNELNQPVTLENVSVPDGQPRSAAFLAVNPRGNVPVLVENDLVLREGAAIMLYLLDKHASPLLPQSGAARARAIEWLMFCNASLHPAYARAFFVSRTITDPAVKKQAMDAALDKIDQHWADVETQLAKTPYLTGAECSVADILLTVIANWGMSTFPRKPALGANVKRLLKAVTARPAYAKALEIEHVEYKAAA